MNTDKKHALALLSDPQMSPAVDISALQALAIAQMQEITRMERDSARRAIMVGLTLWWVKVSLKHGEFRPWLESHVQQKRMQVNRYMRLATVFVERSRVTRQELLARPVESAELVGDDHLQRSFFGRLEKFVGDCSLNELLVKHGIVGVTREGDTAKPADTTGDDGQMFFAEIAEHVMGLRTKVISRENFMKLTRQHAESLRDELGNMNREFNAMFDEAFGRAKTS